MTLRKSLIIIFIVFGFSISIIGGLFYYSTTVNAVRGEVAQSMLAVVQSRADHVETYLEMLQGRIIDFSTDGKIRDCIEALNSGVAGCSEEQLSAHLIINKLPAINGLIKVFIVGTKGSVVASSVKGDTGIGLFNKEYFKMAYEQPLIKVIIDSIGSRILVSAPIYKKVNSKDAGIVLGFVVGEINLFELEQIIRSRVGLGSSGEVLAGIQTEERGQYLFSRLFEKDAVTDKIAEPMKEALFGNEMILNDVNNYRGVSVIAATQYINEIDVGLVAQIDTSEVVGAYRLVILWDIFLYGFIIFGISFIFAYFVVRHISIPLEKLAAGAEIVGKGELSYQIEIQSKNEIGAVAEAFNGMARKLKQSYGALEEKVLLRTQEVEEKNKKLEASSAELSKTVASLELINKLMVGRELKMIEMKNRIAELESKAPSKN